MSFLKRHFLWELDLGRALNEDFLFILLLHCAYSHGLHKYMYCICITEVLYNVYKMDSLGSVCVSMCKCNF